MARDRDAIGSWRVYDKTTGGGNTLYLNTTSAPVAEGDRISAVSATTFTVNDVSAINYNGHNNIAYCFHSVDGFSKIGSYTGNDSTDGVFVYLGFQPKYLMVKRADTSGTGWVLMDDSRNVYNVMNDSLLANSTGPENTARSTMPLDFLSNGFKWRINYSDVNGASGGTNHSYIYMAFAEFPFKFANAR
jgi:hypothetical protein